MPARKKVVIIDSEIECVSIGIVSPLRDYRLCWFLNHALDIEFCRIEDMVSNSSRAKQQNSFSRFKYEEPLTKSEYYVISNKDHADHLLPELKQADYILLIKGNYYQLHAEEIREKIKSIEGVQTAILFDIDTLRSKNNILYYDNEKGR